MDQTQALLQQLRDIHPPAPISWWPLAPGWYVVLALGFILLAVLVWCVWRRWRKQRMKQRILQQVAVAGRQGDIAKLSILIRRVSLLQFQRQQVAGLFGQHWIDFLDQHNDPKAMLKFDSEQGRLLIEAPYREKTMELGDQQINALVQLAQVWVTYNL